MNKNKLLIWVLVGIVVIAVTWFVSQQRMKIIKSPVSEGEFAPAGVFAESPTEMPAKTDVFLAEPPRGEEDKGCCEVSALFLTSCLMTYEDLCTESYTNWYGKDYKCQEGIVNDTCVKK